MSLIALACLFLSKDEPGLSAEAELARTGRCYVQESVYITGQKQPSDIRTGKSFGQKTHGIHEGAAAIIESLQPYRNGDVYSTHALWQ